MTNLLDYANSMQQTFTEEHFNELDSAILCQLAYCRFKDYAPIQKISDLDTTNDNLLTKLTRNTLGGNSTFQLLKVLKNNPRFKNIRLVNLTNKIDIKNEMQFSAITYLLNDSTYYIAFRGTNATTIGWKENFNMSFSNTVPAQLFAKNYFKRMFKQYPGHYYLGGHSKGGNLAYYVGLTVSDQELAQIIKIDNFDGPGFHNQKNSFDAKLKKIKQKMHKYIPEGSLIGILQDDLINDNELCSIVDSKNYGPFQHNMFNWQIKGSHFLTSKALTDYSQLSWQAIEKYMLQLTDQERKEFIEAMFMSVNYSDKVYFDELITPQALLQIGNRLSQERKKNPELWQSVFSNFMQAYILAGKNLFSQKQEKLFKSLPNLINEQEVSRYFKQK